MEERVGCEDGASVGAADTEGGEEMEGGVEGMAEGAPLGDEEREGILLTVGAPLGDEERVGGVEGMAEVVGARDTVGMGVAAMAWLFLPFLPPLEPDFFPLRMR